MGASWLAFAALSALFFAAVIGTAGWAIRAELRDDERDWHTAPPTPR